MLGKIVWLAFDEFLRMRPSFRSGFRDWAGNVSNSPREVTETALAHVIGDKAEQAYRRSDALEKRRKLMEAWASYCEPSATGNIVGSTLAANWSAAVFSASLPLPTSPRDISSRSFSDNDRRDRFLADGAMPPFDSSTPNTDVAHRGGDRASGDRGLKPLAGYQRACDLISGKASSGPFGSSVLACAGKTEPPSRLILSQTSAGKVYRSGYVIVGSSLCALAAFLGVESRSSRLGGGLTDFPYFEVPAMSQNAPSDAGQLVGERNREHVGVQPLLGRLDPGFEPVTLPALWLD